MDKSARKKLLRELQDKEEKKLALSKGRYLHEDIHWRGIGLKVLQIVYRPSFERNIVWEIRKQEDKYVLFESTVSPHNPFVLEPGYDLLAIDSAELKQLVEGLKKIKITIGIPESNMFTLDGTSFEVCLYGVQQSIRIQWLSEPHQDWAEIARMTETAIDQFKLLKKESD